MIKTDKKCVLALITAALLSMQVTGCSAAQGDSQKEPAGNIVESVEQQDIPGSDQAEEPDIGQARQHMMIVWSDYMDVLEKMYGSELWALDYVDAYLESGDWNDLVKARTACIASARYLSELSMTEDDLSEEEYLILSKVGMDTGYQSGEFASVPVFVEQAHTVIRNQILEALECSIYFESSIEILRDHVSAERESISIMCEYTCVETNYLLLTLGDDAVSKPYWSSMQENYPVLSSQRAEWCAVESELEAAADACMDRYEETLMLQAEFISEAEAELYQVTPSDEKDTLEVPSVSAHAMVNVPELLPFPKWYSPDTTGYLSVITGEDGSVVYPESGDELVDAEYGVYMQVENVKEEDVTAYIDIVKSYALEVWKSEDSGSWYIRMPDYNVKMDYEEDTATIFFSGEDVTFAPVWYIWK